MKLRKQPLAYEVKSSLARIGNCAVSAATCIVLSACGVGIDGGDESVGEAAQALTYTYAFGGTGISSNPAAAETTVRNNYATWKSMYLTSAGAPAGCLRVQRPQNGGDTVSEGIAYGMLLSSYLDDRATLDGLWCYAKAHLDNNGLMIWQVSSSGANIGGTTNSAATDADEDMALSLLVASRKWGSTYGADATTLMNRMMNSEVMAGDWIKPGDGWADYPNVVNPSYFIGRYGNTFAAHTGNTRWNTVRENDYGHIANLDTRGTGSATTGLVPDWQYRDGNYVNIPWDAHPYDFHYDACRFPWRLAIDYAWSGDSRAATRLDKLNAFFGPKNGNVLDGYYQNGAAYGGSVNGAFLGPAAAAAIRSSNQTYRDTMWNAISGLGFANDYFKDTIRMVTMMFAAGLMPDPYKIGAGGGSGNTYLVSLKTSSGVNYLTAEGGGGSVVSTNRTAVGSWEKWTIVDVNGGTLNSGDTVYLKAFSGHYLCADANAAGQYGGGGGSGASSSMARPNRGSAGAWETFTISKSGGGQITSGSVINLKSYNNFYMSAIYGGGQSNDGSVEVNRTAAAGWEGFTVSFL